jgi:para-nitrobenzyl esterase
MASHRAFGFDVLTMAERKLARRRAPVYKYQFAWEAPPQAPGWRAYHELEGSFVFDNTTKVPRQSGGGPQAAALAAKIADAWIAFARNGNPSTPALSWPGYTREGRRIGTNNEAGPPRSIRRGTACLGHHLYRVELLRNVDANALCP